MWLHSSSALLPRPCIRRQLAPSPSSSTTIPRASYRSCAKGPGSMAVEQELLKLSQELLQSIADRDWDRYAELCDDSLTAFEPEAVGHLVQGLPFHRFYFDLLAARGDAYKKPLNTISQPHVRMLGPEAAVVSYIRLQQKIDAAGRPLTISTEETRVWHKMGGKWKNVHFHRSPTTPSS